MKAALGPGRDTWRAWVIFVLSVVEDTLTQASSFQTDTIYTPCDVFLKGHTPPPAHRS